MPAASWPRCWSACRRSASAARRRGPGRRCRRRRTSADRPDLDQFHAVELADVAGCAGEDRAAFSGTSTSARRRSTRPRLRSSRCRADRGRASSAAQLARGTLRAPPRRPVELLGSGCCQHDVALSPAARHAADVRDEPTQRRRAWAGWRVRPSRCRARRCRTRRDAECLGRLRDALDRLGQLPADLGFSRLPKLRQSVSASGSPPAQATLRAAPSVASAPARNGIALTAGGPSSETARPRYDGVRRRTAASSPGRRTVATPRAGRTARTPCRGR